MLIWRAHFETPWEEGEGPFFSRIAQEVFSEKVAPKPGELEIGGGFTKAWAIAPQAEGTRKGLAGERNREVKSNLL